MCTFFNFFLTLCVYNSLFSLSDIICSKIAAEQRERPNCILFMSFDFTDCYLHLQKCLLSGADYELRIWLCMLLQVYILMLIVLSWPVMWITDVTCLSAKWELVWYMQLKMTWEKRPVRHWSVSFMHMLYILSFVFFSVLSAGTIIIYTVAVESNSFFFLNNKNLDTVWFFSFALFWNIFWMQILLNCWRDIS